MIGNAQQDGIVCRDYARDFQQSGGGIKRAAIAEHIEIAPRLDGADEVRATRQRHADRRRKLRQGGRPAQLRKRFE